ARADWGHEVGSISPVGLRLTKDLFDSAAPRLRTPIEVLPACADIHGTFPKKKGLPCSLFRSRGTRSFGQKCEVIFQTQTPPNPMVGPLTLSSSRIIPFRGRHSAIITGSPAAVSPAINASKLNKGVNRGVIFGDCSRSDKLRNPVSTRSCRDAGRPR